MSQYSDTLEGIFTCPRCGALYSTQEELSNHVQSHMTNLNNGQYVCTACGATFESEQELTDHSWIHAKPIPIG